jgi:hypothetical protein
MRIHPQAHRTVSLMMVQDCLDRAQSLFITGFIYISARIALFRPHHIELFDELNHYRAIHMNAPCLQESDALILRTHPLICSRSLRFVAFHATKLAKKPWTYKRNAAIIASTEVTVIFPFFITLSTQISAQGHPAIGQYRGCSLSISRPNPSSGRHYGPGTN